jgi:CotH protein.
MKLTQTKKQLAVGLFIALAMLLALVFTLFINPKLQKRYGMTKVDDNRIMGLQYGVTYCLVEGDSFLYFPYLQAKFSPHCTYQFLFTRGEKEFSLVVNSGVWADNIFESGEKSVTQLIPKYISEEGYQSVSVRLVQNQVEPITMEGFRLLNVDEVRASAPGNLIDFEIKQYELTIADEDWAKLSAKRDQALADGILQAFDEDVVHAEIRSEGQRANSELRLKGDWTDHLEGDKWSFRIELKGDNCIYGMQKFSLQRPETRAGILEPLIYMMYKEQGGVTLRYDFADVFINGRYSGVYAVEEFMEKRVIENSKKREGPIIRISEDDMWDKRIKTTLPFANYLSIDPLDPFADSLPQLENNINIFSEKKTGENPTLDGYAQYAVSLLNQVWSNSIPVEQIFDTTLYAKLYAILDVFASSHGRIWHNYRHYFNPITALLEPIPFDEIPYPSNAMIMPVYSDTISTNLYHSEAFNKQYMKAIQECISEIPAFFIRNQTEISRMITLLNRDGYAYDVAALLADFGPRIDALSALIPPAPIVFLSYDENNVPILYIRNDGLSALTLESISTDFGKVFAVSDEPMILCGSDITYPLQVNWEFSSDDFKSGLTALFRHAEGIVSVGIKEVAFGFFAAGHTYGGQQERAKAFMPDDSIYSPFFSYLKGLQHPEAIQTSAPKVKLCDTG